MKVVAVMFIFALCFPAVLASAVWASRATDDTIDNCNKTAPVTLSDQEKQQIVDVHNHLRQTVETDKVKFKKIEWDNMLAGRAQLTANTCELRRSYHQYYCPRVSYLSSKQSGQNLRYGSTAFNHKINFASEILGWWQEKTQYNYNTATCDSGRICGHYLQMAWQKTHKVGCGYKYCKKAYGGYNSDTKTFSREIPDQFFFVCNYYPSVHDPDRHHRTSSQPYGPGCFTTPGEEKCNKRGTYNFQTCECTCKVGFIGKWCEFRDCLATPGEKECNKRGTYNFQTCECTCKVGFSGKWCEFRVPLSETCKDAGNCLASVKDSCNSQGFAGLLARGRCARTCGLC